MQQQESANLLGRYRLLKRIGRGGMGDVWLSEDPTLKRQVAIKTLPPHNQQDQEYVVRFEREAQAAAALNHPHILPIHDYGDHIQADGQVISYIVMPYLAGGSLEDRINALAAAQQGMPVPEALRYLAQAAQAIDYAHEQGVIHRDIKPANMLLRQDGYLMLADFGIARIVYSLEGVTQVGAGVGTPEYMPPEQAKGQAVAASDNYSLAVIAYQLLTGRPPFSAETSYATMVQHMMLTPPPPRQFNPNLSPACEEALLRGLAKSPTERFPTATAFIEAIQRSLDPYSTAVQHEQQAIASPQTTGWSVDSLPLVQRNNNVTRRNVLIGTGVVAALAAAGGGGFWALKAFGTHPAPVKTQTMTP
ncbi:MAG: serine/threonine protein kinase, partial [Ktedonobacteraceae bacterium]|nr:serine/threonine protein kinase [Ktedonobacteraceae bacterium]